MDLRIAQGAGVAERHVVGDEQQDVRPVGGWRPAVDAGCRRSPGAGGADRSGLGGEQGVDRLDAGGVLGREVRGVERRLLVRVAGEVEQAAVVVALEAFVERVAHGRTRVPARFVVDEQSVAVKRRSALQHRQEALAVEVEARRQACAGRLDQGREHVADVDQGLVQVAGGNRPRPPDEVGHVAAGLERPSLAARDLPAVANRRDPRRGAVVADEQEQRVPFQFVLDQLRPHPADQVVHVGDHRREPLLVRLRVQVVRRHHERVVGQSHRVVDEERLAGRGIRRRVLVDRLEHEVVRQVRPEDVLAPGLLPVVRHQGRPPVARTAPFPPELPEPVLVEARLLRRRSFVDHVQVVRQLPLARDHRPVARLRQHVGKGDIGRVEFHELPVVPVVVQPRHQLDPGRRAQRLRMAVLEPHALRGDPVELRRLVGRAAVDTQRLGAEVVGEDDDDVGLGGRLGYGDASRENDQASQQGERASVWWHRSQVTSRGRASSCLKSRRSPPNLQA